MRRRHFITLAAMAASASARETASGRISAGQIGTGHAHAAGKMRAMRSLPDLYTITGICEPDDSRWQKVAEDAAYKDLPRLTLDELLASPARAVAIETRIQQAPAATLRCLQAEKHLHLDKPGALAHDVFKKLRLLAEEKSLALQMGYMLRYNPAFELLFRAQREGWFGEITSIDASMGKLANDSTRKEIGSYEGGGMFELACHLTDAVVTLLGKPGRVQAFSTPTREDAVKDNQLAVFTYPKASVTLRCNHADPSGGPHRRFQVIGTRGAMEIVPLESGTCVLTLNEPRGRYPKGRNELKLEVPKARYDAEFIDLAKAIRGEKPLAWDAAHDIAVHETVLRSAGLAV